MRKKDTRTGSSGQTGRGALAGPTDADVAPSGRGQSGTHRRRLYSGGARLSREEQGGKASLGDDGNIAQRSSQNGGAQRLLGQRVLLAERHCFGIHNRKLGEKERGQNNLEKLKMRGQ